MSEEAELTSHKCDECDQPCDCVADGTQDNECWLCESCREKAIAKGEYYVGML